MVGLLAPDLSLLPESAVWSVGTRSAFPVTVDLQDVLLRVVASQATLLTLLNVPCERINFNGTETHVSLGFYIFLTGL